MGNHTRHSGGLVQTGPPLFINEMETTMSIELLQVDAFADRPFAGNPAAVCFLEQPADEQWMQAVAAEMRSPRCILRGRAVTVL